MMESLTRALGDIEELVAIMSRDLTSAHRYLRVAEVCRDAGRDDEGLDWAERGVADSPGRTDSRLQEFLADANLEHSRDAEVMSLIWALFEEQPELEAYKRLRRYARRTGTWNVWRPRALEVAGQPKGPYGHPGTTLVSIHTWEGELDAVWEAARQFGCQRSTLLKLAKHSEDAWPDDALVVFKTEVSEVLGVADRRNCAEAIGLLRRIQRISARLGHSDDFRTYVAEIRAANARRPASCSMFDAVDLLS